MIPGLAPPRDPSSARAVQPPTGSGGIRVAARVCVTRICPVRDPKEVAGRQAAELIEDGMRVGLGTGSTVHHVILRLAERIRAERLAVRCVPTSLDTERKARALGIPLVGLEDVEGIDLTIDGADEIDPRFDMIKGGGGALLREKVVASLSRREAIVVGETKLVQRLGTTFPLPV